MDKFHVVNIIFINGYALVGKPDSDDNKFRSDKHVNEDTNTNAIPHTTDQKLLNEADIKVEEEEEVDDDDEEEEEDNSNANENEDDDNSDDSETDDSAENEDKNDLEKIEKKPVHPDDVVEGKTVFVR